MLPPSEYVAVVLQVAERDPSIARVLREIVTLEPGVRASALDLLAMHLRARAAPADVLQCVAALRRDEIARRIAEALGPPA
jgi:hypothetical protein